MLLPRKRSGSRCFFGLAFLMHPYRIAGEITDDNNCHGSHSQCYISKHSFVCDSQKFWNLLNLVLVGLLTPGKDSKACSNTVSYRIHSIWTPRFNPAITPPFENFLFLKLGTRYNERSSLEFYCWTKEKKVRESW